jgi:twitching motility protein PilJ
MRCKPRENKENDGNARSRKMKLKKKKASGGTPAGRLMIYMMILLIAAVVAMGLTYGRVALQEAQSVDFLSDVGDQRVLAQEIAKEASLAARGDLAAFPRLQKSRDQFDKILKRQAARIPDEVRKPMADLQKTWASFLKDVDTILQRREVISTMREYIQGINEQIPTLLAMSDEVVATMTEQRAPADQVYIATRQLMLTQRISSNVNRVLEGGEEAVTAADRFGRDAALFGRVIEDMLRGNRNMGISRINNPASRAKLQEVSKLFKSIRTQVGGILERSPEMFQVSAAAEGIISMGDQLPRAINNMSEAYQDALSGRLEPLLVYVFAGVALFAVVLLGTLYWRDSKTRLADTEEQRRVTEEMNATNQEAILRLLDEMGDLADGDLTVSATVTEDITGAIADSINYAIDALRNLVSAINDTTQQVSSAAQQTQATAMHLAEASDHQAQQITDASTAINEMATSIEQVSSNAAEVAAEATRSVNIASQGSEAVQKTIHGMDTIREHIQETSKRIKRLGESSQEIGDIVELINDIA